MYSPTASAIFPLPSPFSPLISTLPALAVPPLHPPARLRPPQLPHLPPLEPPIDLRHGHQLLDRQDLARHVPRHRVVHRPQPLAQTQRRQHARRRPRQADRRAEERDPKEGLWDRRRGRCGGGRGGWHLVRVFGDGEGGEGGLG